MSTDSGRNKTFLIIIGTLLVANIILLAFFMMTKESPKKMRGDKKEMVQEYLKKELGFDQQQMNQYNLLDSNHHEKIKPLFDSMRAAKDQQFKVLSVTNYDDAVIDSLSKLTAGRQQVLESVMLKHFKSVRELCKPAQREKFDTSFYKLFNRRGDGRKK